MRACVCVCVCMVACVCVHSTFIISAKSVINSTLSAWVLVLNQYYVVVVTGLIGAHWMHGGVHD